MDLNLAFANHQRALMDASAAANDDDRRTDLAAAAAIAERISSFQRKLGAAAACAWSNALFAGLHLPSGESGSGRTLLARASAPRAESRA
jgi:hypothetical protein